MGFPILFLVHPEVPRLRLGGVNACGPINGQYEGIVVYSHHRFM